MRDDFLSSYYQIEPAPAVAAHDCSSLTARKLLGNPFNLDLTLVDLKALSTVRLYEKIEKVPEKIY